MLTLTLVIPVFNEEHQIKGCLDAVASQTVMPDEVIVVDNNCTDRTIEIAQKYPFVRVITEKNQGRGYARSAGFDAAKSEIIGRIDADSKIEPDWVEHALQRFEKDMEIIGLTGIAKTSFIPGIQSIKTSLFSRSYYWYVHAGFRTDTMWGATMAIRKSAWDKVSRFVCNDDSLVHEDQDVSIWIASQVGKIEKDNCFRIVANGADYMNIRKALHYRALYVSTKQIHKNNGNLSKVPLTYDSLLARTIGTVVVYLFGSVVLILNLLLYIISLPFKMLFNIFKG
jgi:glycosyltransferase involved in cell wall biosynthesis